MMYFCFHRFKFRLDYYFLLGLGYHFRVFILLLTQFDVISVVCDRGACKCIAFP